MSSSCGILSLLDQIPLILKCKLYVLVIKKLNMKMQHVQMDWKPVDLYIYKVSVTLVMSIQSKETLKRQYLPQYLPTIICVLGFKG